jgi:hypothetical protein
MIRANQSKSEHYVVITLGSHTPRSRGYLPFPCWASLSGPETLGSGVFILTAVYADLQEQGAVKATYAAFSLSLFMLETIPIMIVP